MEKLSGIIISSSSKVVIILYLITKSESFALKGFAILLILFHHIYWRFPEYGILNFIALKAKVGVTIFVFLSGYGLSESLKGRVFNFKEFYKKRFLGIFPAYWVTFLVFISCGTNTFANAYEHSWFKFSLNVLGIHRLFGFNGYNPTWWFISLIIALYALFPIIYFLVQRMGFYVLLLILPTMFFSDYFLILFVVSFVLGVYISYSKNVVKTLNGFLNGFSLSLPTLAFGTLLLSFARPPGNTYDGIRFDAWFSFVVILFCLVLIRKFKWINPVLSHFGKVSYEIFLSHGLIYYYLFKYFEIHLSNALFILTAILLSYLLGLVLNKIVTLIVTQLNRSISKLKQNSHSA